MASKARLIFAAEHFQRFVDAYFNNPETARPEISIPAREDNSDVLVHRAIKEAADRIEALEAENARLREALEWYGKQAAILAKATLDSEFAKQRLKRDMGGRARDALKQEGGE